MVFPVQLPAAHLVFLVQLLAFLVQLLAARPVFPVRLPAVFRAHLLLLVPLPAARLLLPAHPVQLLAAQR